MKDSDGQRVCQRCLPDFHMLVVGVAGGGGGWRVVRLCPEHGAQGRLSGSYPRRQDALSLLTDAEGSPVCVKCRGPVGHRRVQTAHGFGIAACCPQHGVMQALTGWFATGWMAERVFADMVNGEPLPAPGDAA